MIKFLKIQNAVSEIRRHLNIDPFDATLADAYPKNQIESFPSSSIADFGNVNQTPCGY